MENHAPPTPSGTPASAGAAPATRPLLPTLMIAVGAIGVVVASGLLFADLPRRLFGGAESTAVAHFHGRDVSKEHWGGSLELSDAAGKPRHLADFRGKVVLLAFGYTHCPDVCPTTLAKFARVRHLLGARAQAVQGVFVTVDPEHDTGAMLGRYVPAFDPTFVALRGTEAQTDAVTHAYRANYQTANFQGSTLVEHTAWTYILDATGHTRVVNDPEQEASQIAEDVARLIPAGY
jgi:protein SCO1/2